MTVEGIQSIREYLASQNPPISTGQIKMQLLPEPAMLITADADPTDALSSWISTASASQREYTDSLAWLNDVYRPIIVAWRTAGGPAPTAGQVTRATVELAIVELALARRSGLLE